MAVGSFGRPGLGSERPRGVGVQPGTGSDEAIPFEAWVSELSAVARSRPMASSSRVERPPRSTVDGVVVAGGEAGPRWRPGRSAGTAAPEPWWRPAPRWPPPG